MATQCLSWNAVLKTMVRLVVGNLRCLLRTSGSPKIDRLRRSAEAHVSLGADFGIDVGAHVSLGTDSKVDR